MALPRDVTDPGTQQIPLTNVETQAFGVGIPVQIIATVEDHVMVPASASVNNVAGANFKPGVGAPRDVEGDAVAEQSTSATPLLNLRGDGGKPGLGIVVDHADDDVAEQPTSTVPLLNLRGDDGGEVTLATRESNNPGTAQVPQTQPADQVFGVGRPTNVFV
jgi:hypothetical protein